MEVLQENPFVGETNFLLARRQVSQPLKKLPNFLHQDNNDKADDNDGDLSD